VGTDWVVSRYCGADHTGSHNGGQDLDSSSASRLDIPHSHRGVLLIGPLLNFVGVLATQGLAEAAGWLVFIVVGPVMYAFIEGMNYRQVRYEEKDLLRLLSAALATDPVGQSAR